MSDILDDVAFYYQNVADKAFSKGKQEYVPDKDSQKYNEGYMLGKKLGEEKGTIDAYLEILQLNDKVSEKVNHLKGQLEEIEKLEHYDQLSKLINVKVKLKLIL